MEEPREKFDTWLDRMIDEVGEAVDALEPLEREVWKFEIEGDEVTIGGSFAPIKLTDLLTLRDKVVYAPTKIVTLQELN